MLSCCLRLLFFRGMILIYVSDLVLKAQIGFKKGQYMFSIVLCFVDFAILRAIQREKKQIGFPKFFIFHSIFFVAGV